MLQKSIPQIISILEKLYPNPKPTLNWRTPFEALIAVMLSAQCTDIVVNRVTKELFKEDITTLDQNRIAEIIKPCGLFRTKAKNIFLTAKKLANKSVPDTFEGLTALPGVGEKTAQVILAQIFKKPAFPVDTHIHRITNRLGLCDTKTATQTSAYLKKKIPKKYWHDLHLQLISHGRETCTAKRPACSKCPLFPQCAYGQRHLE